MVTKQEVLEEVKQLLAEKDNKITELFDKLEEMKLASDKNKSKTVITPDYKALNDRIEELKQEIYQLKQSKRNIEKEIKTDTVPTTETPSKEEDDDIDSDLE